MSREAVRNCWIALIILAALAGLSYYNGIWVGARIFGLFALVPLCMLAGAGWSYIWDAVDEGKVP